MTIGTFLDNCLTDLTRLRIDDLKIGRIYDGTIRLFKIDDDDDILNLKSKLAAKKISYISFDLEVAGFASHSRYVPVVTITIEKF